MNENNPMANKIVIVAPYKLLYVLFIQLINIM